MEELDLVLRRDSNNVLTTMHDKLEKDSKRTSSCSNKMEYSPAYRTTLRFGVMFSILIVILGLFSETSAIPSRLLCQMECENGGTMHVPTGPFGYCMCRCPRKFVGLRCEFNRISGTRRIRKINRLKRLVKIRKEVEGLLSNQKRRHRHYRRWRKLGNLFRNDYKDGLKWKKLPTTTFRRSATPPYVYTVHYILWNPEKRLYIRHSSRSLLLLSILKNIINCNASKK